jgi:hypothetical protein
VLSDARFVDAVAHAQSRTVLPQFFVVKDSV